MLSLQERRQVLVFIGYSCKARLLPAQVSTQNWELRTHFHFAGQSGWIAKVSYALFLFQALYKILSLVYILIFIRGVPLHQIMIHTVLAIDYGTFSYWYYVLYIQHPDLYAQLLQITLTGNTGQSKVNL